MLELNGFDISPDAVILEPREFLNEAIVGVTDEGAAIYDIDYVTQVFAVSAGWSPMVDSAKNTEAYCEAEKYVDERILKELETIWPESTRPVLKRIDKCQGTILLRNGLFN